MKGNQMTLPLSELSAHNQDEIRDELAERAIDLIKKSPQQRITISKLTNALADESSRSKQEISFVLRYMLHKRKISKQAKIVTEGKGIQRQSHPNGDLM
jgi:hypothetical protein